MPDFVYVLTNPSMLDFVKVGTTNNLKVRMNNLSSHSGVPIKFECYYCCEVEKGKGEEIQDEVLEVFKLARRNPKREFLVIHPEAIKSYLKCKNYEKVDVTPDRDDDGSPEEQESLNREKDRIIRSHFSFSMLNISKDSEITLDRDPTKIAKVTGEKEVEYKGNRGSLGKITKEILEKELGINWKTYRGTDHWSFEGENLTTRRLRLEDSSD